MSNDIEYKLVHLSLKLSCDAIIKIKDPTFNKTIPEHYYIWLDEKNENVFHYFTDNFLNKGNEYITDEGMMKLSYYLIRDNKLFFAHNDQSLRLVDGFHKTEAIIRKLTEISIGAKLEEALGL